MKNIELTIYKIAEAGNLQYLNKIRGLITGVYIPLNSEYCRPNCLTTFIRFGKIEKQNYRPLEDTYKSLKREFKFYKDIVLKLNKEEKRELCKNRNKLSYKETSDFNKIVYQMIEKFILQNNLRPIKKNQKFALNDMNRCVVVLDRGGKTLKCITNLKNMCDHTDWYMGSEWEQSYIVKTTDTYLLNNPDHLFEFDEDIEETMWEKNRYLQVKRKRYHKKGAANNA